MTGPVVFLLAGQGSQHYQMASQLYRDEPVFRAELDRLDAIVAELSGRSVVQELYGAGKFTDEFNDTLLTHPAIVMVELALVELLRADGIEPDILLGSSLGEFTAAAVAGVLTVPECLELVVGQARSLEGLPPGGMLAILADPGLYERVPELREGTDLAARNGPGHFVVSGAEEQLVAAEVALSRADVPCQRVAVEHAFHSRLLDSRRQAFDDAVSRLVFRRPRVTLVSCATGDVIAQPDPEHYWQVVSGPIEFEKAVRGLESRGAHRYVDVGPSGTLHNLTAALLGPERGRSYPLLSVVGQDDRLLATVREQLRPHPTSPPAAAGPRRSLAKEKTPMKVYGFPGQGSQSQGMGADLFDRFPDHVGTADAVLGYSIRELCERNPEGRLRQTQYTQPALYTVSALAYLAHVDDDPVPPDFVVGHSLGEYAALFAAGVVDFETGLRLVARRGELMAQAPAGGMAAVVGCDLSTIEHIVSEIDDLYIANVNAADQVVLSGSDTAIDTAKPLAEQAGARFGRLRVGGALHSPFVSAAAEEFGRFARTFELVEPRVPVIANVDARPHDRATMVERLTRQIDSPVRWLDTVRYLLALGEVDFVELGPGRVLRKLVAKIREQETVREPQTRPRETARPAEDAAVPEVSTPSASSSPHRGEPAHAVSVSQATTAAAAADAPAPAAGAGASFRRRYGLDHACVAGSLYGAVSGVDMVTCLARAGVLAFYGAGGTGLGQVEEDLGKIGADLSGSRPFGANLPYSYGDHERELALVDLYRRLGVDTVEASGHLEISPGVVKFRLTGGSVIAKVSRSDIARQFLEPASPEIVRYLHENGHLSDDEAARAETLPVARDVVVEAGSGWLSGAATLPTLLPSVVRLRDAMQAYAEPVHVGAAGGLGTPEAVAGAFFMGADFVLTGSINQCTVEAATSPVAKDILAGLSVHDVDTAPWPDLFELGGRNTVVRKGLFYPARASKLYELWRAHDRFTDIDAATRDQIERNYLRRPFTDVLADVGASGDAKQDMAEVFRTYLSGGLASAWEGDPGRRVDYHLPCGPAMGAFNDWARGTPFEDWRARNVDTVTVELLRAAGALLDHHGMSR